MSQLPAVVPSPLSFTFSASTLRVVMRDGEPWFVAADICTTLDLSNPTMVVARLDADEKAVVSTDTLDPKFNLGSAGSGPQSLLVVNESGLNAIILRCRDAMTPGTVAHRYRRWVTGEVLPAIRKTGAYIHAPAVQPGLTTDQQRQLAHAIDRVVCGWAFGQDDRTQVYNHLRCVFSVDRWQSIPGAQLDAALALVQSKKDACTEFLKFLQEASAWFKSEVLAAGTPWTPAIKARLTKQMGRQVILPPKVDWLALAHQSNQSTKGDAA